MHRWRIVPRSFSVLLFPFLLGLVVLVLFTNCTADGANRDDTPAPTATVTVVERVEPTPPTATDTQTSRSTIAPSPSPSPTPQYRATAEAARHNLEWDTVSEAPGELRRLDRIDGHIMDATFSPDGRWIALNGVYELFGEGTTNPAALYVLDTQDGEHWLAAHNQGSWLHQHQWLPDGRLLWVRDGRLVVGGAERQRELVLPDGGHSLEVWRGANEVFLVGGQRRVWRVDLGTETWNEVAGLDAYRRAGRAGEPPLSRLGANVAVAPDGTFATAHIVDFDNDGIRDTLWRLPLTDDAPATYLSTVDQPDGGARVNPPEPLAGSPYWNAKGWIPGSHEWALFDTRSGSLVPVADLLNEAGVEFRSVGLPDVSPNGRWLAVPPARDDDAHPTGLYLAPSYEITTGAIVSGTHILAWNPGVARVEPQIAVVHDRPAGTIVRVPLTPLGVEWLEGEPTTLLADLDTDAHPQALVTSEALFVAEGRHLHAFTLNGAPVATVELPTDVRELVAGHGTQIVVTTTGDEATDTNLWHWDVQAPLLAHAAPAWTTFSSDELGITLDYPETWRVSPRGTSLHAPERYGHGPEPLEYFVYLSTYDNPRGRAFEELVTQDLSAELREQFTFTEDTIGPYTVYRTTHVPSMHGALTVFFTRDGSRYVSVALTPYDAETPYVAQETYTRIFERMLDTVTLD